MSETNIAERLGALESRVRMWRIVSILVALLAGGGAWLMARSFPPARDTLTLESEGLKATLSPSGLVLEHSGGRVAIDIGGLSVQSGDDSAALDERGLQVGTGATTARVDARGVGFAGPDSSAQLRAQSGGSSSLTLAGNSGTVVVEAGKIASRVELNDGNATMARLTTFEEAGRLELAQPWNELYFALISNGPASCWTKLDAHPEYDEHIRCVTFEEGE